MPAGRAVHCVDARAQAGSEEMVQNDKDTEARTLPLLHMVTRSAPSANENPAALCTRKKNSESPCAHWMCMPSRRIAKKARLTEPRGPRSARPGPQTAMCGLRSSTCSEQASDSADETQKSHREIPSTVDPVAVMAVRLVTTNPAMSADWVPKALKCSLMCRTSCPRMASSCLTASCSSAKCSAESISAAQRGAKNGVRGKPRNKAAGREDRNDLRFDLVVVEVDDTGGVVW